MKKLLKIILMISVLGIVSCDKEEYSPDRWVIDSPFGNVTVNGPGMGTQHISKGNTQSFYKYLYDYIDVSCNNCAYRVNGKQYSISTRFFGNGVEKPI